MALFRSGESKREMLRRLEAGEWRDARHLIETLKAVHAHRDLTLEDLVPLLRNPDATVRAFAEEELRRRLDRRGLDAAIKSLPKRTSRECARLLTVLLRVRPELAVPRVQTLVMEAERGLSVLAMEALSRLPAATIGGRFVQFLQHERADIRKLALAKIKGSPALLQERGIGRVLAAMAEDEDEAIRLEVMDVLVEVRPEEAVRMALDRIADSSAMVHQRAVRALTSALQRIQASEETEDQLLDLLTDGTEAVRNAVVDIIVRRPDRQRILRKLLLFCRSVMGWMRDRTLQSLRRHADLLSESVLALMEDPDNEVRSLALILGATLESPEAVPYIIRLLEDDDWWLRMIAAQTLGKIRDSRAVQPLIRGAEDPDCALACIEALGQIGDPAALDALVVQLSRPEIEIRVEAIDAMDAIGDRSVAGALEACAANDPSTAVRTRAEELALRLRGKRKGELISRSFRVTEDLKTAVIETVGDLEGLLVDAREMNASDLHILVGAPPTVRIHGELLRLPGVPHTAETTRALLEPILGPRAQGLLKDLKQVDLCHQIEGSGRYRCNIYEERKGLAGSFRVIPETVPTLADIGLPSHLADLVNHHQGLVVVAGPSGSGKSTTLAALVNLFNEHRRSHILLLEDPIEFVHPAKGCLVNQREVGLHTRTFAGALRGALREDPDIIVVGEMRDLDTVRLAIEASETGHLVIGTMNTTSAPNTVDRIVESFPVGEQSHIRVMLSETLKAVIAQSLLPNAEGDGRVAVFETMMGTLDVRMMIRDNKTHQLLSTMQIGESKGHVTVDRALQRMLDAGRITPEAAWSRALNKDDFEAGVSGDFLAMARSGDFGPIAGVEITL